MNNELILWLGIIICIIGVIPLILGVEYFDSKPRFNGLAYAILPIFFIYCGIYCFILTLLVMWLGL